MWLHPATQRNVARLRADGVDRRRAGRRAARDRASSGRAACPSRTRLVDDDRRSGCSRAHAALGGHPVLVTAGPTREAADPVRFLSNGSTGTMGFEIAAAAARRGATVTLLAGPVALDTPPGVTRVDVVSADDLLAAALAHADADLVVAAAAVSDYAPADPCDRKMAKADGDLSMRLRRTPDVLAALGARKRPGQTLVGFALETHDGEAHARAKLARKHLDWIALNTRRGAGRGLRDRHQPPDAARRRRAPRRGPAGPQTGRRRGAPRLPSLDESARPSRPAGLRLHVDSRSTAPPPAVPGGLRYLALGDSYTIGEGVPPADRWPVQLAAALRSAGVAVADPQIIATTGWTVAELEAAIDAADPPSRTRS